MQANKNIFHFLILSALIISLAGCSVYRQPSPPVDRGQYNQAMSNRFKDTSPKGKTVIDSTIELSKKNIELFEQIMVLRQENQELINENSRLSEQVALLEPDLKQARKELAEANDLLIDMTTELNNWKVDILGNREELRQANMAQMDMLLKIAKAMGADIADEQEQDK